MAAERVPNKSTGVLRNRAGDRPILGGRPLTELEGPTVIHRPRATATLLLALLLSAAMPAAAIHAADVTQAGTTAVATTPLDTNLLRNGRFGSVSDGEPVPWWKVEGDVHVETFGTRAWPYPAYGKKWGGGSRYLTCGQRSGLVRQTVDFQDSSNRSFRLKAQVRSDFGGTIGHKIRLSIKATGSGIDPVYVEKVKTLEITNHYKVIVAGIPTLPVGTEHLQVTVELIRKSGASSCKMVADTVSLVITRP